MTDSNEAERGGKRERLVASAGDLMHRHGVPSTTLAQVADAAGVPLGNVYYYFKTKDDLIRGVIEDRNRGSMRCSRPSTNGEAQPRVSRQWPGTGAR